MNTVDSGPAEVHPRLAALEMMILSASGWRAVFGGGDDSLAPSIDSAHRDLVAIAAEVYAESLSKENSRRNPTVVVGTDSRPTGPMIADTAIRVFIDRGVTVRWLGICATPEILAHTSADDRIDGFFYVSASHNPPGHNGFKMGYADGSVMDSEYAAPLIRRFRSRVSDIQHVDRLIERISSIGPARLAELEKQRPLAKQEAHDAYEHFALRCAAGSMPPDRFLKEVRERLRSRPLGIIGELNGSARAHSIDRAFLPRMGVAAAFHNDRAGTFSHQILPEGVGLSEAAQLLERYSQRDRAFRLAYVPDNDGDRGNLVFLDRAGAAAPLDAQSVFALVVMSELAWARYLHREHGAHVGRLAVVANGPTSSRIDDICRHFGATLYRVEVGEANVVSRCRQLTAAGEQVVIMGEGSNGGNITPPSAVRDPLSTLMAMIKLHAFRLASAWSEVEAGEQDSAGDFLSIVGALPHFCTIATDDPRAKMQIGAIPHVTLKQRYEALLPERAPEIISRLETTWGAGVTWQVWNYEGTSARAGVGNRTGEERGGLRVLFQQTSSDGVETPLASVWMRGSGTEPVFRILADCRGDDDSLLDMLVDWQRELVAQAARLD